MEVEQNNQIPFLNVLLIRNLETTITTVYRQVTNTDTYIERKYFAPNPYDYVQLDIIFAVSYI